MNHKHNFPPWDEDLNNIKHSIATGPQTLESIIIRKFWNSHLFWLNSHPSRVLFDENFKFTPFLVKFTPITRSILCRLNFKSMFLYQFNYFCRQVLELCPGWPQTPHLPPSTFRGERKGVNLTQKGVNLKLPIIIRCMVYSSCYINAVWIRGLGGGLPIGRLLGQTYGSSRRENPFFILSGLVWGLYNGTKTNNIWREMWVGSLVGAKNKYFIFLCTSR